MSPLYNLPFISFPPPPCRWEECHHDGHRGGSRGQGHCHSPGLLSQAVHQNRGKVSILCMWGDVMLYCVMSVCEQSCHIAQDRRKERKERKQILKIYRSLRDLEQYIYVHMYIPGLSSYMYAYLCVHEITCA